MDAWFYIGAALRILTAALFGILAYASFTFDPPNYWFGVSMLAFMVMMLWTVPDFRAK